MSTTRIRNILRGNNLCPTLAGILLSKIIQPKRSLFILKKVLNDRSLSAILTCFQPSTMVPSTFAALCKLRTPPEKIIKQLSVNETNRFIHEFIQQERALLRNEQRRPWSIRTRRPFRGRIDEVKPTFREKIELAKKVVNRIGLPKLLKKKKSNRGRKEVYDLKKVIPAIICKGTLSFVDLSNELKNIQYDATIDGSKRYPKKTYLADIFKRIPSDYLQKAIKMYDDMIDELYSNFDDNRDTFVGDNSAITCETLSEKMRAVERILVRDVQPFFALVRLQTNGIRHIGEATNKIVNVIEYLPPGSELLLDGEFDVGENYLLGIKNEIKLQIRQKSPDRIRSSSRKKGKQMFEREKYRRRKLGERVFGNITKRRVRCYYRSRESKLKGCILLGIEHNAIEWYKAKAWCDMFLKLT